VADSLFDSDLDSEKKPVGRATSVSPDQRSSVAGLSSIQRRTFLGTSLATLAGLALWQWRRPRAQAATSFSIPQDVTIVLFSDSGQLIKKIQMAKVVKSPDEWRKQLSPNAYDITRNADTEMAFTGKYWNWHENGIYRCLCCDNALFDSATKFDSGTGWPSFWAPIAAENVTESRDSAFGMMRTAVSCTHCDAHLGHVFDDGPEPSHLRYCINSVSLRFVKRN
jgi:peptide-methionine (R)-S-oxide reductase